jgi:uncharacterized protein (TIGR02147 family)
VKPRPVITKYTDQATFLADMIQYRKKSERSFSVLQMCKSLRHCSPALISLICKGKRSITADRVNDLSKLMGLSASEKQFFKDWIERVEQGDIYTPLEGPQEVRSKKVSTHLLQDWLNVYVKDAFELKSIQKMPERVFTFLGGIASKARIEKSIRFLLSNGYLKKDAQGQIVLDTPLAVTDEGLANIKIRQFHKAALKIAKDAIDQYPVEERLANALIVPIDDDEYKELCEIVEEFAEKLKKFTEKEKSGTAKKLYQVLINVSPTGGES